MLFYFIIFPQIRITSVKLCSRWVKVPTLLHPYCLRNLTNATLTALSDGKARKKFGNLLLLANEGDVTANDSWETELGDSINEFLQISLSLPQKDRNIINQPEYLNEVPTLQWLSKDWRHWWTNASKYHQRFGATEYSVKESFECFAVITLQTERYQEY